ncbi:MAG TPA: polysaccharide deacetylase family protein [Cytophagaceae bacterium]|nr:polysaccharide deacetylase family protein [Cytophagaceae bacterium]
MKNLLYSILVFRLLCSTSVIAGDGPKQIAKIDRSLWPYEINTATEFDFASKMEMLVFIEVLQQHDNLIIEDSIKKYLGLQKVAVASIDAWKTQTKNILVSNFNALIKSSPNDFINIPKPINWQGLVQSSRSINNKMPDALKAWHIEAKAFYNSYVYEQMRLAALFPGITSEILTLQDSEITGSAFIDKQFLLTFDDGPTLVNGSTDKLIATLKNNNTTGVFFILGDMYNARLKSDSARKLHDLYGSNIVGSHAKIHKSHQKYEDWQYSLSYTSHLIDSIIPENKKTKYFRPPYGQRNDKIVSYLSQNNTKVMLWNIDSQDWNAKISSSEVADRVITLMLLWRRGILLFHDTHSKANEALPIIWKKLNAAGIKWIDPKQL